MFLKFSNKIPIYSPFFIKLLKILLVFYRLFLISKYWVYCSIKCFRKMRFIKGQPLEKDYSFIQIINRTKVSSVDIWLLPLGLFVAFCLPWSKESLPNQSLFYFGTIRTHGHFCFRFYCLSQCLSAAIHSLSCDAALSISKPGTKQYFTFRNKSW